MPGQGLVVVEVLLGEVCPEEGPLLQVGVGLGVPQGPWVCRGELGWGRRVGRAGLGPVGLEALGPGSEGV